MLLYAYSIIVSLGIVALGVPTFSVPVTKTAGRARPNSYIITLKSGTSRDVHLKAVSGKLASGSRIKHRYHVLSGYAATLTNRDLLLVRRSKDVERIEQDKILKLRYFITEEKRGQGEDTFDSERRVENGKPPKGAGVEVYSIDTGVNIDHVCFGGRAIWGAAFGGLAKRDGNGHGTHTAATAVGHYIGVATGARVIAVRVLDDSGEGDTSDVIAGVNWVYRAFKMRRRPAVAIMSLGSDADDSFDRAVRNAILGGLPIVVAAGNDNIDAKNISPARVATAVTVGAVDRNNRKAYFSNYGPSVDIQAGGVNIRSAWHSSRQSAKMLSGTSMAAPYIAGVLATAISKYRIYHPAVLKRELKRNARLVCTGQPQGTTRARAREW